MQLDQRQQLSVGLEPTQCTHFSVSPVLKNASMSPASFAASSAPSPELMAATTRTWRSASPEQTVPLQKKKKNRQERWHKNHFRPDKSAIADTLTATVTRTRLAAPSADLHLCGGVGVGKRYWAALSRRGHRVPPREWSRGESGGGCGVGGGRGRLGARANLRRLSETSETAGSSGNDSPSRSFCVRMCVQSEWKCRARFVNDDQWKVLTQGGEKILPTV